MTRHLIHIGYPKAGSTYLQHWFAAHPQLAYGNGSIAGFHDVYAIAREGAIAHDAPLYRVTSFEGLSSPHSEAGQQFMEYSAPRAIDIPTAQLQVCTMLAELFPNATVLIVTRGFRSMILSSYSQYVRSGGDAHLADLGNAATGAPGSRGHEHLVQLAPWNYDQLIGAYRDAFGADNVVVMPYELLRDDAAQFTRVLAERLGIDHVQASRDRVNESLSAEEMYWYPRITRLVRRLPSRRLFQLYVRAAFHNRLRGPIRLLQWLRPGAPVTPAALPDATLESFRGRADSLRDHPLYAPYSGDYLIS